MKDLYSPRFFYDIFGGGSGGGGGSAAVPGWIFTEDLGGHPGLLRSWTVAGAQWQGNFGVGGGAPETHSLDGILKTIIDGDNPYNTPGAADTPLALSGMTDLTDAQKRAVVDAVGVNLTAYGYKHRQGLLVFTGAEGNEEFLGPGRIATTLQTKISALRESSSVRNNFFPELYTAAEAVNTAKGLKAEEDAYSIDALVAAIATAAVTRATEELTGAVSIVTNNADTISRESTSRTAGQSSLTGMSSTADSALSTSHGNALTDGSDGRVAVDSPTSLSDTQLVNSGYPVALADTNAKTLVEGDIESAISVIIDATTGLGTVITQALSSASGAANASLVDAAELAFDQASLPEHLMAMNRFSGQMVDINCVDGASFFLGQALIIRGHQTDVAKFRADLSIQLYDKAFSAYMDSFKLALSVHMTALTERIQERLQTHQFIMAERTKAFLTSFASSLETFARLVITGEGIEQASLGHQSQVVSQLLNGHLDFSKNLADTNVRTAVDARLNRVNAKDAFLMQTHRGFHSTLAIGLAGEEGVVARELSHYKGLVEADINIDLKNIEIAKANALWKFDLIGKGISYLGAPAGIYTPQEKATPFQNALAGASVGAAAAGIPGAIVGGFLGALAG